MPTPRRRVWIGMVASALVHGAALAFVALELPTAGDSPRFPFEPARQVDPGPRVERAIQVIEIRPPGIMVPSGGRAAAAAREPGPRRAEPARATARPALPVLAPARPASSPLSLAASPVPTPASGALQPVAGVEREAAAESRPNRGVIVRRGGTGGSGRIGSGDRGRGTEGRGVGSGTGVTVVGFGGDCITPGREVPAGRTILGRSPGIGPSSLRPGVGRGR